MSPPLTLGLTGWLVARVRRAPLVFNIQDVFPDAAIATGKITNRRIIGLARWLERTSYRASDAVVVLSQDLQKNLEAKVSPKVAQRVHVIANFVDSENIVPRSTSTAYRKEHAGNADTVVMYAGNVGFSQSIHLLIDAARALPRVMFIVNGEGSARSELEAQAAPCAAHATGGFVLVNEFDTGDDSFIKRAGLRLALLVVGAGAR
jgi:colanic acid biosynthesis glycosyl transferase WcaI